MFDGFKAVTSFTPYNITKSTGASFVGDINNCRGYKCGLCCFAIDIFVDLRFRPLVSCVSNGLCRIAHYDCIVGNITFHNSSSTNNNRLSDMCSW